MNKKQFEKELSTNRAKTPFLPKDEEEARAFAEFAVKRGFEEPDVLSSNYVVDNFIRERYGRKVEKEEQEFEIQEELKAKEQLQRLSGLTDQKRIEKLKSGIANFEYTEKMKVALGMADKVDKDKLRQKIKEYNEKLKEDEVIEKEAEVEANDFWEKQGKAMLHETLAKLKEKVE